MAVLAGDPPPAQVRFADFASDTGALDVYVDGADAVPSATYKSVHPYTSVAAGHHTIAVRRAGAGATTVPLSSVGVDLSPRSFSTVAVTGKSGQLSIQLIGDGAFAPPSGHAEVRVVQLSSVVPMVDVSVVDGPTVFKDASYPNATPYAPLPPGSYVFRLTETETQREVLRSPISLASGQVQSLFVTGGVGVPIEILSLPDAVASPARGGVRAGEGGMALPRQLAVLAALLIPLLLGVSLLAKRAEGRSAA
jgi:hypothetical protein